MNVQVSEMIDPQVNNRRSTIEKIEKIRPLKRLKKNPQNNSPSFWQKSSLIVNVESANKDFPARAIRKGNKKQKPEVSNENRIANWEKDIITVKDTAKRETLADILSFVKNEIKHLKKNTQRSNKIDIYHSKIHWTIGPEFLEWFRRNSELRQRKAIINRILRISFLFLDENEGLPDRIDLKYLHWHLKNVVPGSIKLNRKQSETLELLLQWFDEKMASLEPAGQLRQSQLTEAVLTKRHKQRNLSKVLCNYLQDCYYRRYSKEISQNSVRKRVDRVEQWMNDMNYLTEVLS